VGPVAVVEDLDELEDGSVDLCPRHPAVAVDEFLFQGGEPARGNGSPNTAPLRPRRLDAAGLGEERAELARGVLPRLPRSEWKMKLAGGLRWTIAMRRASETRLAYMWSASCRLTPCSAPRRLPHIRTIDERQRCRSVPTRRDGPSAIELSNCRRLGRYLRGGGSWRLFAIVGDNSSRAVHLALETRDAHPPLRADPESTGNASLRCQAIRSALGDPETLSCP
jgi:hypothetical protein